MIRFIFISSGRVDIACIGGARAVFRRGFVNLLFSLRIRRSVFVFRFFVLGSGRRGSVGILFGFLRSQFEFKLEKGFFKGREWMDVGSFVISFVVLFKSVMVFVYKFLCYSLGSRLFLSQCGIIRCRSRELGLKVRFRFFFFIGYWVSFFFFGAFFSFCSGEVCFVGCGIEGESVCVGVQFCRDVCFDCFGEEIEFYREGQWFLGDFRLDLGFRIFSYEFFLLVCFLGLNIVFGKVGLLFGCSLYNFRWWGEGQLYYNIKGVFRIVSM